ncbi:LOW QUALITY PROTEIN: hypothetical protein HID58_061799, partial [Brassica napus]
GLKKFAVTLDLVTRGGSSGRLVVVVLEANLLVPGVVSVAARGIGDSSFSLMDPSGEYITKSRYNLARLSNNVSADQTLET